MSNKHFRRYEVGDIHFKEFCSAYEEAKTVAWLSGNPCSIVRVDVVAGVETSRIVATAPHQPHWYDERSNGRGVRS